MKKIPRTSFWWNTYVPHYLVTSIPCENLPLHFDELSIPADVKEEEARGEMRECEYLPLPVPIGYGLFEHGEFFMASTAVIVMHGEEYPEGRKNLSTRPRPRIRPFPNIPQNAKGGRKGRTLQETKPNGLKLRLSSSKRSKASILKHYLAPYSTIFKKLSTEHELMMA